MRTVDLQRKLANRDQAFGQLIQPAGKFVEQRAWPAGSIKLQAMRKPTTLTGCHHH